MHSDEVNEIFNGLMLFRSQLQQPTKDANNPFFKQGYVTLEGVMKSIDQGLKGTGLSYSQVVANDEHGNVGVKTILTHKSGQYLETGLLSLKPEKSNPQGYGSAITYAKRYQLSALFGISSDKDDDGNQASPSNKPHQNYQKQQAPKQQNSPKGRLLEFQKLLKQVAEKLNASTQEVQKSLINITKQKPEYVKASEVGKQDIMITELKNMLQSKG
ncbi:single-stranded DNA-binding protein [Ligilactobacillus salitolerans]|uniref:Single-stranded DNA-binding protein n=1 Tax=Ligilactobacillus salitolerans TaxID=1808352 RepID=A0A401IUM9_9LACO|nr:ERF family protein [Ligilactobacillus salitolerans]GBG95215.1 single-stranded DNA-binding protein [Ligilactobacillus salitolerans]